MNPDIALLKLTAFMAAEVGILILFAMISERFIRSAHWRPTIWQVCALSVLLVTALELTGAGRAMGDLGRRSMPAKEAELTTIETQPGFAFRNEVASAPSTPVTVKPSTLATPTTRNSRNFALPLALTWILGTGLLLGRILFTRAMMLVMSSRTRQVDEEGVLQIVRELAPRLGISGRVRMIEFSRLKGPIAFGLARRFIGLPPEFARDHTRAAQEVILAHELAHLAARDNAWQLLADIAAAILWWHPLVWLMRRRLQDASEAAADHASLLIQNGPAALAECLLALGKRLQPKPGFGWLNIGGFRSGLGLRVQRLFEMSEAAWNPASRVQTTIAKVVCPTALVVGTVLCSGWLSPAALKKGTEMKNPMWKRSLPAMALLAFMAAESPGGDAEKTLKTAATPRVEAKALTGQKSKGATLVRRKLEQITLEGIQSDNLPLSAVIDMLMSESQKRDPEHVGVNFLMKQFVYEAAAVDPSTGLPRAPELVDLGSVTIRIMPGLRNLRLIDALNAIMKVAERPLRYTIEDYGVVITQATGPQGASILETRTFQISQSENFFKGIESTFGIHVPDALDSNGLRSRETQQQIFQELFQQVGIEWESPKSIFFNELNGIVMVRAAQEDMPLITATIQTLGGFPTPDSNERKSRQVSQ